MTRAELLTWALAYVAADTRFQAARKAWAGQTELPTSPALAEEYFAARKALDATEAGLGDLATAIIEHVPDAPERHHGRTRFDAPKGRV